jgi:geranylgeranyl diphosphate synthase type II
MQNIAYFAQYLEKEITNLDFPLTPKNLYDPLRYFMNLGGKRMRPMLTLMSAELFGNTKESALPAALAVEIFHNFSLIHDDLMDKAPLRRNKPTVHTKWNEHIAILSGDVLLIKAYQELCKLDPAVLPEILSIFNKTAIEVCEGQQMDMDFETLHDVSSSEYIEMIRLKTSVLLACALEMGGIIAKTSIENRRLLYEFGQHLGIAFQIQDDFLDVYGDAGKFGKQVGGDILSDKKTFLLLRAFELANQEQKEKFISLRTHAVAEDKIKHTKELYDELNIISETKKAMDVHYEIALKSLDAIDVDESKKTVLRDLAAYLLVREV